MGLGERLNRYLARSGLGARRKVEELIRAGRVAVNGRVVTTPGARVDASIDCVTVDGRRVQPQEPVYILLHKPPGYLSTVHDPRGRPTVLDLVPAGMRVYPVGRLDWDASGLLLLTNDGSLAFRLTHPRFEVPRTYRALVKGKPSRRALARLRRGVEVAGRRTVPAQVRVVGVEGDNSWLEITVHEGRYHQVKLMAEAVGHPVLRLVRTRMGPLQLGRLEPGRFRFLTLREVTLLRQVAAQTGGKPRQEANMKAQG